MQSIMQANTLPPTVSDTVIDVSHHNGTIDWPAVAAAGITLVFIKATQGAGFADPRFEANRRGVETAGLLVVPYHFLDVSDPDAQVEHFLDVAGLVAGRPAMMDWESAATASAVVAFGQTVTETSGREPVGYYGYAQLRAADPVLARWPLMLPEYPRGNRPGTYQTLVSRPPRLPPGRPLAWDEQRRPYHFHQYTPAGRIPGIATPVDRSVWTGDLPALRSWYAAN